MMLSTKRFACAAAVLVAALFLAACSGRAENSPPVAATPEVLTVRPVPAEQAYVLRLPARTQPQETARIYSRATGFVERRLVDIGDEVKAGTVMAVISTPEADAAVREARALLAKAAADEVRARVNHDRARVLAKSGVVSKEMYDDRKANYEVARAARVAAAARLAAAQERQGFQQVRAPFAGRVVARNVERGDRVNGDAAAAQPLFVIHALDPLRVEVDIPQSAALQVRMGLDAEVTFPELRDQLLHARVARTAGAISAAAGFMRVELSLPNPGGRIPAGMAGTVSLHLPRAVPALLLPNTAVVQRTEGTRVAVVEHGRIQYRNVTSGRNLGERIEIISGLTADDTVVLSPNALLLPGTRVSSHTFAVAKAQH
jgi:RND family efflux transporter MFP subunit